VRVSLRVVYQTSSLHRQENTVGETIGGCSTEFVVRRLGRSIVVLDRGGFVEQDICPRGDELKNGPKRTIRTTTKEGCRIKTQA
jgi:hypothetical protein